MPIVTFINHCHATWMRTVQLENVRTLQEEKLYSLLICEGRPYEQSIRKVFSSEDIGIVLIGNLEVVNYFFPVTSHYLSMFKLFKLLAYFG